MMIVVRLDSGVHQMNDNYTIHINERSVVLLYFNIHSGMLESHSILLSTSRPFHLNVRNYPHFYWDNPNKLLHCWITISDTLKVGNQQIFPDTSIQEGTVLYHMVYKKSRRGVEIFKIGKSIASISSKWAEISDVEVVSDTFFLTGYFRNNIHFNETLTIYADTTLTYAKDAFIVKYHFKDSSVVIDNATSLTGIGDVDADQVLIDHTGSIYLKVNTLSSPVSLNGNEIGCDVNDQIIVILTNDLSLNEYMLCRPESEEAFYNIYLFKDFNNDIALHLGLQTHGVYFQGEYKDIREQSGGTVYHIYLNRNNFKQNVFWSKKPFYVDPFKEEDGLVLYRVLLRDSVFGSLSIPYSKNSASILFMQKCINNILEVPESASDAHPLMVYPNPFSNYLKVNINQFEPQKIEVYDIRGSLQFIDQVPPEGINTTNWSYGMYIVKGENGARQMVVKIEY
jgi:hypothetical protein